MCDIGGVDGAKHKNILILSLIIAVVSQRNLEYHEGQS